MILARHAIVFRIQEVGSAAWLQQKQMFHPCEGPYLPNLA